MVEPLCKNELQLDWEKWEMYAFPPLTSMPKVLSKIRANQASMILIPPLWPQQSWYLHILHLSKDMSMFLPLSPQLLTQTLYGRGAAVSPGHYQPPLVAWWDAYASWCSGWDIDPTSNPATSVSNFLTFLVDFKVFNMLVGYVTAISVRHDPIGDIPHATVVLCVKGLLHYKHMCKVLVPPWNLEVVLHALKKSPFESVSDSSNKQLTWKAVFLVAITFARRAGKLYALHHDPPCISFNAEEVTLYPDVAFLPKVNTCKAFHASNTLDCHPSAAEKATYYVCYVFFVF